MAFNNPWQSKYAGGKFLSKRELASITRRIGSLTPGERMVITVVEENGEAKAQMEIGPSD
jgi:hypothetical protein